MAKIPNHNLIHPCKNSAIFANSLLKPSSFSLNPSTKFVNKIPTFRCDSQNSRNWTTVDYHISKIDPIHIIPTSPVLPMSSNAAESVKYSKKVCLFYCPETKALAERIAAQSDAIQLRTITWRWIFSLLSFRVSFAMIVIILKYTFHDAGAKIHNSLVLDYHWVK